MAGRHRIHPAVACTAMACITLLTALAEHHSGDPMTAMKMVAIAIIAALAGLKLRHILPVT